MMKMNSMPEGNADSFSPSRSRADSFGVRRLSAAFQYGRFRT